MQQQETVLKFQGPYNKGKFVPIRLLPVVIYFVSIDLWYFISPGVLDGN